MPTRGNYICVTCCMEMRPVMNGAIVEELLENGEPYRIWSCDLWACPTCGAKIAAGFGKGPIAEYMVDAQYNKAGKAEAEFAFGGRT